MPNRWTAEVTYRNGVQGWLWFEQIAELADLILHWNEVEQITIRPLDETQTPGMADQDERERDQ